MGRRGARKAERRARRRSTGSQDMLLPVTHTHDLWGDEPPASQSGPTRLVAVVAGNVCGRCREFVEDGDGGRGTCLHPGSGVLSPWTDTAACDFYDSPRR